MIRKSCSRKSPFQNSRLQVLSLEDRVQPAAFVGPLAANHDVYDTTSVLVKFVTSVNPSGFLPAGALIRKQMPLVPNLYQVNVPAGKSFADTITALKANKHVVYAQPDYRLSSNQLPNDTGFTSEWGMYNTGQTGGTLSADIKAPAAWDISTGSGKTIVAVIDSGVDYNHPDLKANMWVNAGESPGNGIDDDKDGFIDDLNGYNFVGSNGNPMDDNSHGTHVAGTIGAVGNNGIGVRGVNWTVQIMALKFLDSTGSGSTSNAINALNFAVSHGAKISNNSWGGSGSFNQALSDAITNAQNAGHIFVAAAGNSSANNDSTPTYPASFTQDNIIAVAATDKNDSLASYSNYGSTSVDIAAPGSSIYSTLPNNSYGLMSGTSMAAPHVTGAVALLWDAHPSWTYKQVINQILGNTDLLASLSGKVATGGRLNIQKAMSNLPAPSAPTLSIGSASVTEGNSGTVSANFTVTLSAASANSVTVNYSTADGTATIAGSDYAAASGTLTFAPGETSKTISVLVNGDKLVESNEQFYVNLAGASNANIATSQGTGTILNDDAAPLTVGIANASVIEGNSGTANATFTISLSAAATQNVTVSYATSDGNAVSGSDYLAATGSVTFFPGETSKTVVIKVNGDTLVESNETFFVTISNPVNVNLGSSVKATGTIQNDDTTISINDVSKSLSGGSTTDFTITLAQASALTTTVKFATANGSLRSPGGYNSTSGTLTFAPGETSKTVTVKVKKAVKGDYFYLNLNLSAPVNGVFTDSQGLGTVI